MRTLGAAESLIAGTYDRVAAESGAAQSMPDEGVSHHSSSATSATAGLAFPRRPVLDTRINSLRARVIPTNKSRTRSRAIVQARLLRARAFHVDSEFRLWGQARRSWARASASKFRLSRMNHFSETKLSPGIAGREVVVVDRDQVDPVPFQALGLVEGGDQDLSLVVVGLETACHPRRNR